MKKRLIYMTALAATLSLSACFEDDSQLGSPLGDITIEGIESSYTKNAYVGEKLQITPKIETDYADMDYQWLLLGEETGTIKENGDTIQPTVIGTEKDLNYEVAIAPGTYQVRLVAKARSNGYTQYAFTSLTVKTTFSTGFYVLKQTTDGNTELDMLNNNNETAHDILTKIDGQPLSGAPQWMGPVYSMNYVNPDNDEMENTSAIIVTSQHGDFTVRRSTDMLEVFNRNNLFYDTMSETEKPYGIFLTTMGNMNLITSAGLYSTSSAAGFGASPATGQYGLPVSECGGSAYFYHDISSYGGGALWDETSHTLYGFDYNAMTTPLTDMMMGGSEFTTAIMTYDCLHCGYNNLISMPTGVFIMKDNTDSKRYLYLIDGGFMGQYLRSRTPLTGHMAAATCYSTNGASANYIYCVDGGRLYAANFVESDLPEVELKPQGIPSGETITFITNQFWSGYFSGGIAFDYLIIGTQTGNSYKLYFYETNGGAPIGDPIKTMTGEGNVKCVRFLNTSFDTNDWQFGFHSYNIND